MTRRNCLLAVTVGLLLASYGSIHFIAFPAWDLNWYRAMAMAAPGLDPTVCAPLAYRLLGPYLAGLMPGGELLGFKLLTLTGLFAVAFAFDRLLRSRGIRAEIALVAVVLYACNRYFFGLFAWDYFKVDDVLAMLALLLLFQAMHARRAGLFAVILAVAVLTREEVLLAVPVSLLYAWQNRRVKDSHDLTKWVLAALPGIAIFCLVRRLIATPEMDQGIFAYYVAMLRNSLPHALGLEAWTRRLLWDGLPLSLFPLIFWRTTRSFFASNKHVLLYLALVFASSMWGIDAGAGDVDHHMSPAFIAFYWLIAVILQREFAQHRRAIGVLVACAAATSLHHLYGLYPLPNRHYTLALSLLGFLGATMTALYCRFSREIRSALRVRAASLRRRLPPLSQPAPGRASRSAGGSAAPAPFTVGIPVCNESALLRQNVVLLVSYLDSFDREYEIILGSNGSTDDTPELAGALARQFGPRVTQFHLAKQGVGLAFREILRRARYPYLVILDIDLSTDLDFVPRALELLEENEFVVGAKALGDDRRSWLRRTISLMLSYYTAAVLHTTCVDYSNGAKAYRVERIRPFAADLDEGSAYVVDAVAQLSRSGANFAQVPVTCIDSRQSRFNLLREGVYRLKYLAAIKEPGAIAD